MLKFASKGRLNFVDKPKETPADNTESTPSTMVFKGIVSSVKDLPKDVPSGTIYAIDDGTGREASTPRVLMYNGSSWVSVNPRNKI